MSVAAVEGSICAGLPYAIFALWRPSHCKGDCQRLEFFAGSAFGQGYRLV